MLLGADIKKIDKTGYDKFYKDKVSGLSTICNPEEYIRHFKVTGLSPFCYGGHTKGYVRGVAVRGLIKAADATGLPRNQLTIIDAGCGLGELSVYLACEGFRVIGIDISEEGCRAAEQLAGLVDVSDNCQFFAESLESLSIPDSAVDFIIGHASLHHFIKYEGIPGEFVRVMKPGARAFFADSFGENWMYLLFQDRKKMEMLGDVNLTKQLISEYFKDFKIELVPMDWFTMLDKLYSRLLPKRCQSLIRRLSHLHFWLDRRIPSNRITLFLAGAVMTSITAHPVLIAPTPPGVLRYVSASEY